MDQEQELSTGVKESDLLTPKQDAVRLYNELAHICSLVRNANGGQGACPTQTVLALLNDSRSLLRYIELAPAEQTFGSRRIISNMLESVKLMDEVPGNYSEVLKELNETILSASTHGLTIDGYALSPATHASRARSTSPQRD